MSSIQSLNRAAFASIANVLDKVALNPQPLPPRVKAHAFGDEVSLNPQPLPPRSAFVSSLFDRVALNPQPLPPKEAWGDDFCGNFRIPIPPRPNFADQIF